MLGIKMPVNFDSPYKATSIIEFWRRWHMTLSRFLRDYLYFALRGNRRGVVRRYANLFVTMLLGAVALARRGRSCCGAPCMAPSSLVNHGWRAGASLPQGPAWINRIGCAIGAVLTFAAVFGAWAIFRADDLPSAIRILRGLAGLNGHSLPPSALAEIGEAARWVGQARGVPSSIARWIVSHFGAVDADLPTGMARGRSAGVLVSRAQLAWIAVLLAIAWLAPNTRQIMARAEAFISDHAARPFRARSRGRSAGAGPSRARSCWRRR